jgi:hypothetical protein
MYTLYCKNITENSSNRNYWQSRVNVDVGGTIHSFKQYGGTFKLEPNRGAQEPNFSLPDHVSLDSMSIDAV